MRTLLAIFTLAFGPILLAASDSLIRKAAELSEATFDRAEHGSTFAFEATLLTPVAAGDDSQFSVADESGAMIIWQKHAAWATNTIPAGAKVRLSGFIDLGDRSRAPFANCTALQVLGRGVAPKIPDITGPEFASGRFDCRIVRVIGTIRDILSDEIDPRYVYAVLDCDGETVYLPGVASRKDEFERMIGARIEITGVCTPSVLGGRRQIGRFISAANSAIRILAPPATDPFDFPPLGRYTRLRPPEIAKLGRHRITGRVLASWMRNAVLIRANDERIVKLELSEETVPKVGTFIEAVGFPESDLYNTNLTRAYWRKANGPATDDEPAQTTSTEALLTDGQGHARFDPFVHGRLIRLTGIVRNLPGEGNADGRFYLESGKFIVPVDISSCPTAIGEIGVGYEIAVTGICIMETENWRPNAAFPRIRGFTIVTRTPGDVAIIAKPSWWTASHALTVLAALFAALVAILIWNLLLRRAVNRRGKALEKEITARIGSELKVEERTRLAIELHDTLAQNLTGVSLEIDAASDLKAENPDLMSHHLDIAAKTLKSCRDELRNCLWDLRNQALEEEVMDSAIRHALTPHLFGAALFVRFNVPRERFADDVAHALLRIIRELTVNAIRHGHAKTVYVAGVLENGQLLFSVKDDGCGFDPETRPGVEQGHYGLEGISERIDEFDGDMAIESSPGKGSKVTIRMNAEHTTKQIHG